ncbi:MAG: sulfatase [Opitutae bacterium]|nr:sulfatase [Opitutae bacterium]
MPSALAHRLCVLTVAFLLLGLSGFGSAAGPAATPTPRRPNLLFILTDDQRWDALGVVQREQGPQARWPWFQTPHLDRIAAEGVRFRNAFVVQSLCSPSRAAFLSGQYGHRNGVTDNSTHFPAITMNQARLLRRAGYATAYIGKFHMALQKERPGFEHIASYTSQGEYYGSTFWVNGVAQKTKQWVDDAATDYALEFMRARRDQPWMMVLGFKTPHTPRQPPERARQRFAGESVRPAPNAAAMPAYGKGQRAYRGEETGKPVETDTDSAGNDPYLLNYFRTLSAIDDNIGRVLDELAALQLADDTVVVFASDNGYYLGEHGLGDKRSAYDESMRIPLLLRYPRLGRRGQVIDEMVLNLDLALTFLELAGVAVPPEMQGQSWLPLLQGKPVSWRQAFMFVYRFERNLPATPALIAVRTPTAKLIEYPGHEDWTEVFDLSADPHERNNLARDPAQSALRQRLQTELAAQKEKFGDPFALSVAAIDGKSPQPK